MDYSWMDTETNAKFDKLSRMGLSTRAKYVILNATNERDVESMCAMTDAEIRQLYNCGHKTFAEIRKAFPFRRSYDHAACLASLYPSDNF